MNRAFAFLFILVLFSAAAQAGENWPQWRGPEGTGVVADAKGLPVKWSETENILWKVPMPAWSGSTPAVWGGRIFLASPERKENPEPPREGGRGRVSRDPGGDSLLLICYNLADGKELWTRKLGAGNYFKMKQNMSSPSPVTDGEHVWISTGTGVLACFDFDGNEKWRLDIQEKYGRFGLNHGYANSVLLYEDRIIFPVLHGMTTDDPSYLLALEKKTGKEIWRAERPTEAQKESPDSYATPQLLMHNGKPQIVINGADVVTAHDMATGKEIWRVGGMNPSNSPMFRVISSCVVHGDMIFAPTRKKPLTAIRAGGEGDVTGTHVMWRSDLGPDVPTPVTDGKYLWIVDDRGVFVCLDVKTGEPLYEPQRIATGTYSSSPVLADGKIYAMSEIGTTTVLEAGPEFKILSTNELDAGYTLSSPVVVGNKILLRTESNLYLIGSDEKDS
jgi:outer membrane protein assembly factor BamB